MPSSYTPRNGLEIMAKGEKNNEWGTITNTNLTLIEEALDGQKNITLTGTGTTGSPNTVAISDGALSDGRHRFLNFKDGGDLGGTCYVQLTPDDAEKLIFMENSLSGGRDIVFFQGTYSSSRDYVLENGDTALIRFSGGGASASFALRLLSLLVRDVDGATINSSTIGATTPSSGAFSSLDVTGATPRFQMGVTGLSTGAVTAELGTGRTGSGSSLLDFITDSSASYALRLWRDNAGVNAGSELTHKGTGTLDIKAEDAGTVTLSTDATVRVTVKPTSGYVGVGTSTPSTILHANGPIRTEPSAFASLPSASGAGAGAMAWVTDLSGGAGPVMSDGVNWRVISLGATATT